MLRARKCQKLFGVDNEIADSKKSLADTEGLLNHKFKLPKSTKPTGAGVPPVAKETKLDGDVITTLKNEKAASQALGQKWEIKWE